MRTLLGVTIAVGLTAPTLFSQQAPPNSGAQFEVVSIKLNSSANVRSSTTTDLPDGGIRAINRPLYTFIALAYPPTLPVEIVGLPEWAKNERYDLRATASLAHPTPDDRAAMLRAMLADRFKLVVHFEKREQDGFDLVLARKDGKLGSGLTQTNTDCSQSAVEAAPSRPGSDAPPPPCTIRTVGALLRRGSDLGDLLEGDAPIGRLAEALRLSALRGQPVVDKTGLAGSYRVTLTFNAMATLRPPTSVTPTPNEAPSLFTAIQEQLGLKLQPSRTMRDTLIIDHLERPTPN